MAAAGVRGICEMIATDSQIIKNFIMRFTSCKTHNEVSMNNFYNYSLFFYHFNYSVTI